MSNAIFPTLVGLDWNVSKTPQFSTRIQTSTSGREVRISNRNYPIYVFKMQFNILRDDRTTHNPAAPKDELKKLAAFFLNRRGSFQSFLYLDPSDNKTELQGFGIGDGVTTSFQLARRYGLLGSGFAEPVENIKGSPLIYINNVLQESGYTVSNTGLVTFSVPPAQSAILTWTGEYYYRVRFINDSSEFNQFMYDLWELKRCELIGAVMNKI